MSFDAAKTAQTIENLAKESIDKSDSIQASVKLADQWMALTPQQRSEVGKELEKQFDNSLPNTMPRPKMELNDKGECIGIDFAASSMDFFSKKDNLRVASFAPETGGQVVEVQSRDDNEKTFKQLEGISFDSDKTESGTTNASLKKAGALAWGSPAEGGLGTGSAPGGMRPMGGDMAPASQPAEISLLAPEKNTKQSQFLDFTNLFK